VELIIDNRDLITRVGDGDDRFATTSRFVIRNQVWKEIHFHRTPFLLGGKVSGKFLIEVYSLAPVSLKSGRGF